MTSRTVYTWSPPWIAGLKAEKPHWGATAEKKESLPAKTALTIQRAARNAILLLLLLQTQNRSRLKMLVTNSDQSDITPSGQPYKRSQNGASPMIWSEFNYFVYVYAQTQLVATYIRWRNLEFARLSLNSESLLVSRLITSSSRQHDSLSITTAHPNQSTDANQLETHTAQCFYSLGAASTSNFSTILNHSELYSDSVHSCRMAVDFLGIPPYSGRSFVCPSPP